MTIQDAFALALQHHQSGRLPEAEALYRQILAVDPQHADTLHHLGLIAHQAGMHETAAHLISQAIALAPTSAVFHSNLGEAYRTQGLLDEAIAAYRQAIALKPNFPEPLCNLGIALCAMGHVNEAITAFRQAIALKPNFPEAYSNLGNALQAKGEFEEAIAVYRQAIVFRQNFPEAYSNLGNVLKDQGQLNEAIAAYRQSIAFQPNSAEAHYNLGNILKDIGQLDEALAATRQAIALRPDFPEACYNLGDILRDKGQLDEAIACHGRAIELKPDDPVAHSSLLLSLNYHPHFDAKALANEQLRWNQQHAEPLRNLIQPHPNEADSERPLRIGYVSPDFRQHVVGYNILPFILRHDGHVFEVFCYAQVGHPDALTERFRARAHHWRNIVGLTDEQVAALIREDRIDVLVDLALHTASNRLPVFARKPAPVQVTFAGYPGSTGLSTIDYRLSDPYLDPPGGDETLYSEQTVRLAHSFWCYDPVDCGDLSVNALPAQSAGFITFGCLNSFSKTNDAVLHLWAKVLQAIPSARLLLLAPEGDHRQRIWSRLGQEGIDSRRVEFVALQPRRKYLELYHRIDLGLDTLPYNGHTTSLESLWMGVPVVTLVGQTIVGRAGRSQLMNLGLPELIASTPEDYVRLATALANDRPRLTLLRSTLRQRMEKSPIMDAPRFTRDIEAAYRKMWRDWCAKAG